MPAPTKFFIVVPNSDVITASKGTISVSVYTSESQANAAAVKAAIGSGAYAIVMEAVRYADPTLDPASITAQTKDVT